MESQMTYRKLDKLLKAFRDNPNERDGKAIDQLILFLLDQEETDLHQLETVIRGYLFECVDRLGKRRVA